MSGLVNYSGAGDHLAVCMLLFKKGNIEATQNILLSVPKEELVPVLVDVYKLLLLDGKFTAFGQLMKQCRPDAFVEYLLHLVQNQVITANDGVAAMLHETPCEELENVPLLKEFLEALLSDKKTGSYASKYTIDLLTKIYLKKLHQPVKIHTSRSVTGQSLTKSSSMFGPRHSWLGHMPPFNGRGISRSCLLRRHTSKSEYKIAEDCNCWHCNEDLLRLQSLLCSTHSNPKMLADVKDQLVDSIIWGNLSLMVLCSQWKDAVQILCSKHIEGVLPYASDTFAGDQNKWCQLFVTIKEELLRLNRDDPKFPLFDRLFYDVLAQLAEMLHPTVLVDILPKNKDNKESIVPYVKRCTEKHQAMLLKDKVIAIGTEVKAMM